MPGFKPKSPSELDQYGLVAYLIAFTVISAVIATGPIATMVMNPSSVITALLCGAALVFILVWYSTAAVRLVNELRRRKSPPAGPSN
jgi:hypothetical protein